jgi:hypothetical protein
VSPRRRTEPMVSFRGPPHRLTSLVPLPEEPESLARPIASLEGVEIRGLAVRTLTREGLNMGKMTLRLPRSTPPGEYAGSVEIGGREHPVTVEVEPRPRVEASPSRLSFEVQPGAEVTADVTLLNTGNVPFEIPAASTFCMFDGGGLNHAFWVAFTSDPAEGKQRIDLLLDDLAESHGGLVEARARATERTLAPGESRQVQLTLRFSDRIRPGHAYAGSWGAQGLTLRVRARVPTARSRQRSVEATR